MRSNGAGRPVVSVDIDGTLADYHQWFLRFAAEYLGREMPDPTEINPGLPLWKHMRISRRVYRETKLAYRQGGLKRSMPCLPGAGEVLRRIRRQAEVWICTTRPYLRLDNIDPDTREWLRRNKIPYDALLFDPTDSDRKYDELVRQAGDRVACVVEDLPEQAIIAGVLGLHPILLRDQPYNQDTHDGVPGKLHGWPAIHRWQTAEQLQSLMEETIDAWKQRRKKEPQ